MLPQAFLTGPAEDAATVAERCPAVGRPGAAGAGRDRARARRLAILCGYLEACTGRYHDSALFVDQRGCALANYRRTHLVAGDDPDVLARGQWLTVVPVRRPQAGRAHRRGLEAPEPARALTLAGADVLLALGSARRRVSRFVGEALLPARAFENGCALAYANACIAAGAPRSRDPRARAASWSPRPPATSRSPTVPVTRAADRPAADGPSGGPSSTSGWPRSPREEAGPAP